MPCFPALVGGGVDHRLELYVWSQWKTAVCKEGVALLSLVLLRFALYWISLEGFEYENVTCDSLCLMRHVAVFALQCLAALCVDLRTNRKSCYV